jgi:hypothetical protein
VSRILKFLSSTLSTSPRSVLQASPSLSLDADDVAVEMRIHPFTALSCRPRHLQRRICRPTPVSDTFLSHSLPPLLSSHLRSRLAHGRRGKGDLWCFCTSGAAAAPPSRTPRLARAPASPTAPACDVLPQFLPETLPPQPGAHKSAQSPIPSG